ncbi:MAG: M24 family metallopeptidase, partial [Clostridia bacterium]|nr:M24 family metallopeptidase [Clostridia bacterium]
FDIGALYQGYHSDMTRTYAFGEVSEKQKRVYQTVLEAQKLGLEAVKSGVFCKDVDAAARNHIYQAGFEGYFGHSTGHGVGLEIHELPFVSQKSDTILQSGMVITVEPGIYLPGEFGIRIEDMVVVTADGCINLATLPKELIVL